ncbi:MAG: asparaginase [Proteobacteria bacterium]|nr:asparaginase [Pseudomonadota bacterium]
MSAPLIVEVTRGSAVESRHSVAVAIATADGKIVESHGDVAAGVFPRSAIKPIQSLGLLESGAADAFAVPEARIALSAASHGGEPMHTTAVLDWLAKIGLDESALECGPHMPTHAPTAEAMIRTSTPPGRAHNNCSGKHSGMLTVCRHLGLDTRGYTDAAHPLQKRIEKTYEDFLSLKLDASPRGIDGCSLPQIAVPVSALAVGIARFGKPDGVFDAARAAACKRMAAAIVANPFMLAGTGRFCTRALIAARGHAVLKTGAEGVYMAAIPAKGIGIALKVADGAGRAAEVAMARLLDKHGGFPATPRAEIDALINPVLKNYAGLTVGDIRPAPNW